MKKVILSLMAMFSVMFALGGGAGKGGLVTADKAARVKSKRSKDGTPAGPYSNIGRAKQSKKNLDVAKDIKKGVAEKQGRGKGGTKAGNTPLVQGGARGENARATNAKKQAKKKASRGNKKVKGAK